jgi:glutamate synthase (NADPH/NADH) small chain
MVAGIADETLAGSVPPRAPRPAGGGSQDSMPSRYPAGIRALSMLAFAYVVFAFVNARMLHWFEGSDGEPPVWLSNWTEYGVILGFGIWRTLSERNPYTRKRLGFLTAAVAVFWWLLPSYLRIPEPFVGALPGQAILPQLHAPGTLTFFVTLLLVFLFGRRVICGWNCPCVGIRETVGFAFRDRTIRGETAWRWRHTKWFFFALYLGVFALVMIPGAPYVSPVYSAFLGIVAVTYFGSFFVAPLVGNRFYCRYLCPYGATFGLLNHVGFYGIRMDTDECVDCRRCEQVCDMGIPVWSQGKEHGRVTGLEDCMGCGRCVVSCPTDALEFRDFRNEFMPKLRMDASYLLKRSEPPTMPPRIEPPKRPAAERGHDWGEDRAPLALDDAIVQASRCLDCGVPGCRDACPLHNRIPEWLEALAQGNVEQAAAISNATSNMPEICGALCPKERLCEGACTLQINDAPVTIGALERFITDEAFERGWRPEFSTPQPTGKTAAVIGAGPAGLACADELNKAGFQVTVHDRQREAGGLLAYGVPSFKLDKASVARRRNLLQDAGVRLPVVEVDELMLHRLVAGNDAVFLGVGTQTPRPANLPGAGLAGVIDGLSFLSALNASLLGEPGTPPDLRDRRVLVLGGGDTAMDCARSAVRHGASRVTVAYRRGPEMMRASPKEIAAAREEGVDFVFHKIPQAFVGTGLIEAVRFESGELACDAAIVAFGQLADRPAWLGRLGVETDADGFIMVDGDGRTTNPKLFAGGDNTHGPDLVVTAVAAGREAGRAMAAAIIASPAVCPR